MTTTPLEGMLAMLDERQAALGDLRAAVLRCDRVFGPTFWTSERDLVVVAPAALVEPPAAPRQRPPPSRVDGQ